MKLAIRLKHPEVVALLERSKLLAPLEHLVIWNRRRINKAKNIHIGEFTSGTPEICMWSTRYQLTIGKFCSIGGGVRITVDGNHRVDWISTYPFGPGIRGFSRNLEHAVGKGDMVIGNDVWIWALVIILPGVQIGNGAVIGTGSVVTRDVGDYEIVADNPTRLIRKRFSDDQIAKLKKIKWWDWSIEKIAANHHLLMSPNIDEFIENSGLDSINRTSLKT
jgi:acetyltransferase-like isoleucine patch superfamily enzyme